MKTYFKLIFLLFFFSISTQVFAQKGNENKKLTAIRFEKMIAAEYSKINIKAISVDKKGVLRATKGYEIIYYFHTKQIVIQPIGETYKPPSDNFDVMNVPGGLMICTCGGGGADNCKISVTVADDTVRFFCDGSCDCGSFIIYDNLNDNLEFETAGGNWDSF